MNFPLDTYQKAMKPLRVRGFSRRKVIHVHDKMQNGYSYVLSAPYGKMEDPTFRPELTPPQMLALGIFEGKYLNDCREEFPSEWFRRARDKLSPEKPDISKNFFQIKSRQPLSVWREKGWILDPDPRGWFQWYCRYYIGRRLPEVDAKQIKRWKAFQRHYAQLVKHCTPQDLSCRRRQRQALLQWGYNSIEM